MGGESCGKASSNMATDTRHRPQLNKSPPTPREVLTHGANEDGKEPRSVPVLRLTFCFAALGRNVAHEASKSKKCDNKATDMAQISIMHTHHNTETAQHISLSDALVHKGSPNKKG
eukprot:scaffold53461_cov61-Attheya_sp.AAC.2